MTAITKTDPNEDQLLSFEDIPLYAKVYYRGREGHVIDKGKNVSNKVDARHIKIQYTSKKGNSPATMNVHENVVNRRLRDKEGLWFDFDHKFTKDNAN